MGLYVQLRGVILGSSITTEEISGFSMGWKVAINTEELILSSSP